MSLFLKPVLGSHILGTFEVYAVRVSRKTSVNEVIDCGSLSHATMAELLEPLSWVVLMYA